MKARQNESTCSKLAADTSKPHAIQKIPLERISPDKITVAIFCALAEESVAVRYSLDERLECQYKSIGPKHYIYSFGRIGDHNVVIARPSQMGPVSAALCAATVNQQFPNVRFALMVGIGAGIPNMPKRDIRLGDIAVSIPRDNHPGVLQYDFGKYEQDGKFILKGTLNKPPPILINADGSLEEDELMDESPLETILEGITQQRGYARPTCDDILFEPAFRHVKNGSDCSQCMLSDVKEIVLRPGREEGCGRPVVHRGLILSGGGVVKSPEDRDRLQREQADAICFEMEAAGIADELPCLVVRGICDYADTHKQDNWHRYAAAVAAAYAKAILLKFDSPEVEETMTMGESMRELGQTMNQISNHVKNLHEVAVSTQKELTGHHDEKIYGETLEWLSPIDPSVRHDEIRTSRMSGTCEQILRDSEFQCWVNTPPKDESSGSACWVGDPGQGKTFTMSRVVDYLCETFSSNPKIYTTYLYCDYQKTRGFSATALLGAIVRQLLAQFTALPPSVVDLVRNAHHKLRRPSARMDELHQVLNLLSSEVDRVFVCIDALDECTDAENLVAACAKFSLKASFLFIGRQSIAQVVRSRFPTGIYQVMQPQNDDIQAVISALIEEQRVRQPDIMPNWFAHKIRTGIARLANGMFLLASLHAKIVLSHGTIYLRQQALLSLPSTLEQTYGQTLERIRDQKSCIQALKILAWIHCVGPLSLDELRNVLAVESHHTRFEEDNLPSSFTVLDCCLGLVRLDTTQRDYVPRSEAIGHLLQNTVPSELRGNVTLVHSTLSVYLESNPLILDSIVSTIAMTCLTYMKFQELHQERTNKIRRLMKDSWIRLLWVSKSPSQEVLDRAWSYCMNLNTLINQHNFDKELILDMLPEPSRTIAAYDTPVYFTSKRPKGQSIIHTACMIGLDCLDYFPPKLASRALSLSAPVVHGVDLFGISLLGWTLLSRSHFERYQGLDIHPSALDSFEYCLRRAGRLIQTISVTDPSHQLWDLGALEVIRKGATRTEGGDRISYFSKSPSLFLLGNMPSSPEATRSCISLMATHWKFNFWSSFRRNTTSDSRLASSAFSRPTWSLVVLNNNGELHISSGDSEPKFSQSVTSAIEDPEKLSADQVAAQAIHVPPRPQSPPPQTSTKKRAQSTDTAWQKEDEHKKKDDELKELSTYSSYVVWLGKEVTALFEPGATNPATVTTDWTHFFANKYCKDLKPDEITPFEGTKCTRIQFPRNLLLHIAVAGNSYVMVDYALRTYRIDPNLRDHKGQTALQLALRQQFSSLALILIRWKGLDLGLQDADGMTALHLSAKHQQSSCAAAILDRTHGVHVDLQDDSKRTALHYAADQRSRTMVKLLLDRGADVNIEDKRGNTPLHLAILKRDPIICSILSEARSEHALTASNVQRAWGLAVKAGAGFMITVLRLLQQRSQTHLLTTGSSSSSREIQQSGKLIQMLMSASSASTFTEKDLDFILKLSKATSHRRSGYSSLSITSRGEDFDVSSANAGTAIRQAMVKEAGNVTVFLMRRFPVDLNHLGENGESALHLAVVYNLPQVVEYLLLNNMGLDLSAADPQGCTAVQLALTYKRLYILQLLLESPLAAIKHMFQSCESLLRSAVLRRFSEAIPLLLQCELVSVNDLDDSGRCPLHRVVSQQDTATARLVLACTRVDVTKLSLDGRNALQFAAQCAGKEMVSMLLQTGKFDVRYKDGWGKTALEWARPNPDSEVMKLLEEAALSDHR